MSLKSCTGNESPHFNPSLMDPAAGPGPAPHGESVADHDQRRPVHAVPVRGEPVQPRLLEHPVRPAAQQLLQLRTELADGHLRAARPGPRRTDVHDGLWDRRHGCDGGRAAVPAQMPPRLGVSAAADGRASPGSAGRPGGRMISIHPASQRTPRTEASSGTGSGRGGSPYRRAATVARSGGSSPRRSGPGSTSGVIRADPVRHS